MIGCLILEHVTIAQTFETGEVIDTVKCRENTNQSYALYLPSYYTEEKQWPIVYVFDPAARGGLPARLFMKSAEELGYIIVCSNNSRNGSWQIIFEAARAIKKDTESRFKIDSNRVYTSGFSGGSKGAMTMAKGVYKAKGILACGGAYPLNSNYLIKPIDSIYYAAIVGNVDMNYLEHQSMAKELTASGVENALFITNSPHRWASSEEIYLAMQWLEFKTNKEITKERKAKIRNSLTSFGDSVIISKDAVYGLPLIRQLTQDLYLEFDEDPAILFNRKEVQRDIKNKEKQETREQKERDTYIKILHKLSQTHLNPELDSVYTADWWKQEIDKWKWKEKSGNVFISHSAKRLSNFIWANFAEKSFNYEEIGDYEFALKLNDLWQYAQPESLWATYSRARIFAGAHKDEDALKELNRAHELGMNYRASLNREPVFDHLKNYKLYQTLLEQLE